MASRGTVTAGYLKVIQEVCVLVTGVHSSPTQIFVTPLALRVCSSTRFLLLETYTGDYNFLIERVFLALCLIFLLCILLK
jgi:hypothetical protein